MNIFKDKYLDIKIIVTIKVPEIENIVQVTPQFKTFDTTHTFLKWSALPLWESTRTPREKIHCEIHSTIIWL